MNALRVSVTAILILMALGVAYRDFTSQPWFRVTLEPNPIKPATLSQWERADRWNHKLSALVEDLDLPRRVLPHPTGWEFEVHRDDRQRLRSELDGLQSSFDEHHALALQAHRQEFQGVERRKELLMWQMSEVQRLRQDLKDIIPGQGKDQVSNSNGSVAPEKSPSQAEVASQETTPKDGELEPPTEDWPELMTIESEMDQMLQKSIERTEKNILEALSSVRAQTTSAVQSLTGKVDDTRQQLQAVQGEFLERMNQQRSQLQDSMSLQNRNWTKRLDFLDQQLRLQQHTLAMEITALDTTHVPPPEALSWTWSEEKIEAPEDSMGSSFKLFLIGVMICFGFNLLWEMAIQRSRH